MSEAMTFPDTVEEFMDSYKIVDTEQVYTNGTEMVSIYRMRQWFQHEPERKKGKWLPENRTMDAFWVCSVCGFPSEAHAANILYNFCPHCGADMRADQDG